MTTKDNLLHQFGRIIDSARSGITSVQTSVQTAIHQPCTSGGGTGASYFYPSTLDLQRSKRSGWLRRHPGGGAMGALRSTWQRRWCAIKGDYLYFYAGSDEGKPPIGNLFLPGARVVEHGFCSNEQEKFRFEIIPEGSAPIGGEVMGGCGAERGEGCLMSAESEDERRDWIQVINSVLYSSVGGAIFGQELDLTLRYELSRDRMRKVPEILEACVNYLRSNGLREEGIFRLPGRTTLIKSLYAAFNRGERPPLECPEMDVHTAASLLKLYLRELPGPLIPVKFYEPLITIVMRQIPVDENEALEKLGGLLCTIPVANYNTLQYLCSFLSDVAACSDTNKMTVQNLATVFVTSFVEPELNDPELLMATVPSRTICTCVMIQNSDRLFRAEFSSNGAAVLVDDLLGLDGDSVELRDGGKEGSSGRNMSIRVNSDLLGLDFLIPAREGRESGMSVVGTNDAAEVQGQQCGTEKTGAENDGHSALPSCTTLRTVMRGKNPSDTITDTENQGPPPDILIGSKPRSQPPPVVMRPKRAASLNVDKREAPMDPGLLAELTAAQDDGASAADSFVSKSHSRKSSLPQVGTAPPLQVKSLVRSSSSGLVHGRGSRNPLVPPRPARHVITKSDVVEESIQVGEDENYDKMDDRQIIPETISVTSTLSSLKVDESDSKASMEITRSTKTYYCGMGDESELVGGERKTCPEGVNGEQRASGSEMSVRDRASIFQRNDSPFAKNSKKCVDENAVISCNDVTRKVSNGYGDVRSSRYMSCRESLSHYGDDDVTVMSREELVDEVIRLRAELARQEQVINEMLGRTSASNENKTNSSGSC